jgi:hypothetical protein
MKGELMPLIVNYTKHKSWDASTEKFSSPKVKEQADRLGHQLMTLGISEISDKTVDELIIRQLILDKLYGGPTHTLNSKACTVEQLRELYQQNLGLFIEGRWSRDETRWKFVARHAKGMMHDVERKVTKVW